jgi:hypothetical protein
MDSYRGRFHDHATADYDAVEVDDREDEADIGVQSPPPVIGQDERRMQVRAYNYWAGLLGDGAFPVLADLQTDQLPDFAPHSVHLDFTDGVEDPRIAFLGEKLAAECGTDKIITRLSDVPGRSLLSRITDHYMQILANEAPIGFEAEFVNRHGHTILYRGILLPFSSDGAAIDHILGVINWKELADPATSDSLAREIDAEIRRAEAAALADDAAVVAVKKKGGQVRLAKGKDASGGPVAASALTAPLPLIDAVPDLPESFADDFAGDFAGEAPQDLAGCLEAARAMAKVALGSEDRSRAALYAAIGRAWDFALAAFASRTEFKRIVTEAGLAVQNRAPLTPVVKLVFGADYDKTRLTEYATALAHAERMGIARGALAAHLAEVPGGLKGVINEERRLRRSNSRAAVVRSRPAETTARKLRGFRGQQFADVVIDTGEFALLMVRRLESGELVVLGNVAGDKVLLERAAKQLLA